MTHVATQGLNDPPKEVNGSNINSWVKEYSLEYSSDGKTYNGYYFDKDLKVRIFNTQMALSYCGRRTSWKTNKSNDG